VKDAAVCACLPLGGVLKLPLHSVDGRPKPPNRYLATLAWMPVTPEFFRVMDVALLAGREFAASDAPASPGVAIVNETFALQNFPDGHVVGRRLLIGTESLGGPDPKEGWREIVGVVADIHESRLQNKPRAAVFVPLAQLSDRGLEFASRFPVTFLVRTQGDANLRRVAAQAAIQSADPLLPVFGVRSMGRVVEQSLKEQRFQATFFGAFAAIAVVLVSWGVYGVVSHSVSQRAQEIAIRVAVGASPASVTRLIVSRAVRLGAIGIAIGAPAALAASRILEALLFDVAVHDIGVFVAVPVLLCCVAVLASFIPALRASRTDVMAVLKEC
jgi:hypothetical protein